MYKKVLMSLLSLVICFGLTACDNKENNNTNNDKNNNQANENIDSTQKEPETKPEQPTEKEKYSEEEYKSMCEKLNYKTIARSPDNYIGHKWYGTGEVIQVVEETDSEAIFRINVTPAMSYDNTEVLYYEDTVLAVIYDYDMNNRLLENDIIDFWGMSVGNYTYETVLGSDQTVPLIQIDYFSLK